MLLKSAAKRKSRLKKPCQEPLSRLHDICFFPQPQRHHSKHLRPITLVRLSMANSAIARDAHTSTTHLTSRFGPLVIECSGPPRDHHHRAPHARYPSHAAQRKAMRTPSRSLQHRIQWRQAADKALLSTNYRLCYSAKTSCGCYVQRLFPQIYHMQDITVERLSDKLKL